MKPYFGSTMKNGDEVLVVLAPQLGVPEPVEAFL